MSKITIISILALVIFGCESNRKEVSSDTKNCDFRFQIIQKSAYSYTYNTETGHLKKLIDPFKSEELYADTTFFIPKENLCELMKLFQAYEISKYPKDFHPESGFETTPEPSYYLEFTINEQKTEINWTRNTEIFKGEAAFNLRDILNKIDSIVLSSPEFKQLPKGEYKWL